MLKFIGGVLLVSGTAIGGGMLGLPIATAAGGFSASVILLLFAWALMTFTAFLTLEANLWFAQDTHFISMVKHTLGVYGEWICWSFYLLFLYSLVAAYIAAGQDTVQTLFINYAALNIPLWLAALIFLSIFGVIVVRGVRQVEKINTLLMMIKLVSLLLLIAMIVMHMHVQNLEHGKFIKILPATTVAITSFGFSIIIPTIRRFFNDDLVTIRRVVLVGSLLPLFCYLLWELAIFGSVENSNLIPLTDATKPITGLLNIISDSLHNFRLSQLAVIFTSCSVLTAFVCVSLGLVDYIKDGLSLYKYSTAPFVVAACAFLPPLLVVIFYPDAFIMLLSLAGLFCVLLQALLPALIVWRGRYQLQYSASYQVIGGKLALVLSIIAALAVVVVWCLFAA